uniref:F-box/FBD/LRR-repeat protein At1g13570-like n=1 Tax=Erigeron canadensis TaxID=72917 RepID=UPI001CB9473B|nr:F-box/FBD/LRR-repeat protein At1g13570-like [Erigeron canadensis]
MTFFIEMTAKCRTKDMISTLPQNIIETILCHLHVRDAVRTSVLSKNWRYSWTRIPKLVFVEDTFKELTAGSDQLSSLEQGIVLQNPHNKILKKCKFLYVIYQVLLMHQGPILQFTLDIEACEFARCLEIDQIILHLSRSNTVTELKLRLRSGDCDPYQLPLSIYSLHQLTDLHLRGCLSEYCKLLQSLSDFYHLGHIPLIEPLFERLRLIGHLTIANEWMDMCLTEDKVPRKLATSLVHLKYLSLDMCFICNLGLPLLAFLIKSSPNLEIINLLSRECCIWNPNPVTLEDHSDIWLEHLYELKIEYVANLKTELEVVKLILAKSPVLKKARIVLDVKIAADGVPQVLPAPLVHLKEFILQDMCYIDEYGSPFLSLILRSSPNLERLFLTMYHDTSLDTSEIESVTLKDYADVRLEHLNEFQIVDMHNLKHELEFVKLILKKSPMLKKVSIFVDPEVSKDEEMLISRNLLHFPRASPLVEVIVGRLDDD